MALSEIKFVNINELRLDDRNPRLAEFSSTAIANEGEIIQILWENMDVQELVMSIIASGFFQHEPLIITEESEQYVVIEGNRRLAAVKLLSNPDLAASLSITVPSINDKQREGLQDLPCLVEDREAAWRYLGFKHINGPAKWGSYAKSQYIADVHQIYNIPLQQIAEQIGDTHNTVQRLFQGLMVIQQAEKWGVFVREDRWQRHFSFSHIYTGITYPGISSYIGLNLENNEDPEPVPPDKKDKLGELCLWLYGSKRKQTAPVIQSQNPHLRQLDAVLNNPAATVHLTNTKDLQGAFTESRPISNRFEEYLVAARDNLRNARAILSEGYDESDTLLEVARGVATLARDVYDGMVRKQYPNGL